MKYILINPTGKWLVFFVCFQVRAGNSGQSFDAEFSKPLVLIDLFIMDVRMHFVQRNHL